MPKEDPFRDREPDVGEYSHRYNKTPMGEDDSVYLYLPPQGFFTEKREAKQIAEENDRERERQRHQRMRFDLDPNEVAQNNEAAGNQAQEIRNDLRDERTRRRIAREWQKEKEEKAKEKKLAREAVQKAEEKYREELAQIADEAERLAKEEQLAAYLKQYELLQSIGNDLTEAEKSKNPSTTVNRKKGMSFKQKVFWAVTGGIIAGGLVYSIATHKEQKDTKPEITPTPSSLIIDKPESETVSISYNCSYNL